MKRNVGQKTKRVKECKHNVEEKTTAAGKTKTQKELLSE